MDSENKKEPCPFCRKWHDYEKSSCDRHDGTKSIRIRDRGPMTDVEKKELGITDAPSDNKQDLGVKEAASDSTHVLQKALNECPWPKTVWPSTVDSVGRVMRENLGDAETTAISGTLMRHGWRLAVKRIQELLSEKSNEVGAHQVSEKLSENKGGDLAWKSTATVEMSSTAAPTFDPKGAATSLSVKQWTVEKTIGGWFQVSDEHGSFVGCFKTEDFAQGLADAHQRSLSALVARIDELEKDKQRLDWLNNHSEWHDAERRVKMIFPMDTVKYFNLRDTVDAALLKEAHPQTKP